MTINAHINPVIASVAPVSSDEYSCSLVVISGRSVLRVASPMITTIIPIVQHTNAGSNFHSIVSPNLRTCLLKMIKLQ